MEEDLDEDADDLEEPAACYCTRDDWLAVLQEAETFNPLTYVRVGHYPHATPDVARSAREIPDLGISSSGQQALELPILLLPADEKIVMAPIAQAGGRTNYFVGPALNGRSVTLVSGGRYKDNCLIEGSFKPTTHDLVALGLYESLLHVFGHRCVARPGCFGRPRLLFVGQEAVRLLQQGVRLTPAAQLPFMWDLERF